MTLGEALVLIGLWLIFMALAGALFSTAHREPEEDDDDTVL